MTNREQIYAALFAKLQASASFATASRRIKALNEVPPSDHPALFQLQKGEVANTTPNLNTVWRLNVDVFIYVHTQGDRSIAPSTILNPLIDAVETAIAPSQINNRQTLGGLVEHCFIAGEILIEEGNLGEQAVAVIPIEILTA